MEDLRWGTAPLTQICRTYAPSPDKWRQVYRKIWGWTKTDPVVKSAVEQYMEKTGTQRHVGGRPPKDGGDKSWQEEYCEAILKYDGNRHKAAAVTPYAYETIYEMLTPGYSSYDKEFASKVHVTDLKLAAKAEELMVGSLDPSNFETFEAAKIAQAKSYVAEKVLRALDKERWGQSSKLEVQGTVKHEHFLPKEQRLLMLVEEQEQYRTRLLSAGPTTEQEEQEIIEGEIVEPVQEEEGA